MRTCPSYASHPSILSKYAARLTADVQVITFLLNKSLLDGGDQVSACRSPNVQIVDLTSAYSIRQLNISWSVGLEIVLVVKQGAEGAWFALRARSTIQTMYSHTETKLLFSTSGCDGGQSINYEVHQHGLKANSMLDELSTINHTYMSRSIFMRCQQ